MSVIRIHKTNNFTVMSNYHFKEKKMRDELSQWVIEAEGEVLYHSPFNAE